MKKFLFLISFVVSTIVAANLADQDLEDALLGEPQLDMVEEADVLDLSPKTNEEKTLPTSCNCQCLTLGLKPKNKKYFSGVLIDGNCVCPCAVRQNKF